MIRHATLFILAFSVPMLSGCAQLNNLERALELNRQLQEEIDEMKRRYETALADANNARQALTSEQMALARIYRE